MNLQLKKHNDMLQATLPLLAAIVLSANVVFIAAQNGGVVLFTLLHLKALILALPYLLAQAALSNMSSPRGGIIWLALFTFYSGALFVFPLHTSLSLTAISAQISPKPSLLTPELSNQKLDSQIIWFFITASVLGALHHFHKSQFRIGVKAPSWIQHVFSLDAMVATTIFIWVIGCTGIFLSTPDPMNNQPLAMRVDLYLVVSEFPRFLAYVSQFLWLGLILFFIYWVNRYCLIRRVLSVHGLTPFAACSLLFILLSAPLLSATVLLLPLSNVSELTLLPSENANAFDLDNFRFMFVILAVTTPVILAFERKSFDVKLASIAKDKVRTELQLLQQQINPHFLFNTLNNLYALTLQQSDQAPKSIEHLSSLLRYTVYQGQQEWVWLEDEIAYLNDYLALQRLRYQTDCRFNISWPQTDSRYRIPPLLLIVLLENAFKHGIEKTPTGSFLDIQMTIDDNVLHFICKNAYVPYGVNPDRAKSGLNGTKKDQCGVGLANVHRRLSLLPGVNNRLISEARDGYWIAILSLELQA